MFVSKFADAARTQTQKALIKIFCDGSALFRRCSIVYPTHPPNGISCFESPQKCIESTVSAFFMPKKDIGKIFPMPLQFPCSHPADCAKRRLNFFFPFKALAVLPKIHGTFIRRPAPKNSSDRPSRTSSSAPKSCHPAPRVRTAEGILHHMPPPSLSPLRH